MKQIVLFDKQIYSLKTLQRAISDYRQLAAIDVHQEKDAYRCTICSRQYPLDTVCFEFKNYVLEMTAQDGGYHELD